MPDSDSQLIEKLPRNSGAALLFILEFKSQILPNPTAFLTSSYFSFAISFV